MNHLAEANAAAAEARDELRQARLSLLDIRAAETTPDELRIALEAVDAALFEKVDRAMERAQSRLGSLSAETAGAQATAALTQLADLMSTARLVTRADVDEASAAVQQGIEHFAGMVEGGNVAPIDKAQAQQLIADLQADIEARGEWSERISKVVSSAVNIGKTAVKILA